jgi:hypothetical protein
LGHPHQRQNLSLFVRRHVLQHKLLQQKLLWHKLLRQKQRQIK